MEKIKDGRGVGAFMGKEGCLQFQGGGQTGTTAKVTLEAPACTKALRQELWSGRGWVRVAGARRGRGDGGQGRGARPRPW